MVASSNRTITPATTYGKGCTAMQLTDGAAGSGLPSTIVDIIEGMPMFNSNSGDSEDCLYLNGQRPANVSASAKLPVLVWIFGGGFELGNGNVDYSAIISRSVSTGSPIMIVAMNYRLAAFGFLGGKEVRAAGVGNLALQDQRESLRWAQKNIAAFGGDPAKVTVWGQSAGAISIGLQMVTNGGDPQGLFRGAFMQSGSQVPFGKIENGQEQYDIIAKQVGCFREADSLACLRTVPYQQLRAAMDQTPAIFSYSALHNSYLPRVDGVFITDESQLLMSQGKYARIPFVTGDCDDEGT